MTKFSNKFKKTCFWPILGPFSQFLGQKIFLENLALSCTTSYGFWHHAKIQKKLMIKFKENAWTDGRMEGWTDRPYFIRPFRLPPGVQKQNKKHSIFSAFLREISNLYHSLTQKGKIDILKFSVLWILLFSDAPFL